MVEFLGVSKTYARAAGGRVDALVDVSFEVKLGELAVVTGPSGSGKSTLIRLVSGEEAPTKGRVLVNGTDVGRLPRRGLARFRRTLGVVPETPRLLQGRTVFGNVTLVLRALGMGRSEARDRAWEALREAGLAALRNALAAELSAGERERLVLARALAPGARLLLADEPTASLDEGAAVEVLAVLRTAHARGLTVIVASRVADLARRLDARALGLEAGRLRPEGVPA